MPRNPMYNSGRTDAQSNGLTNDPKGTNPQKHYSQATHNFDLSYYHLTTERFADINPFMWLDTMSRDKIPFASRHSIRSYTLQAPMEDRINKHKFYTIVPYRAILPNLWEQFYTNPTFGDDVPDDVYPTVNLFQAWLHRFNAIDQPYLDQVNFIRALVSAELLFSRGSLTSVMRCNLWTLFYQDRSFNLDTVLQDFYSELVHHISLRVEIQPDVFVTYFPKSFGTEVSPRVSVLSDHDFLDLLRSGNFDRINLLVNFEEAFILTIHEQIMNLLSYDPEEDNDSYSIDISPFIAYQISCISQVTDTSVDYLFNAKMFRDFLFPNPGNSFEKNGYDVLYDTFSGYNLENVWFSVDNFDDTVCNLFSFAKSLKFGDYYVSARPKQLANGDITLDAGDTALDNIRKIVYTRFLNWNNRVGPKYEDYIKDLTGMSALPEADEPAFISHSVSVVNTDVVENTGSEQRDNFALTSQMHGVNGSQEFNILISEPSIVLGLSCYDVAKVYTRIMDRAFLKRDRFDFFNHMLQYVGDQAIFQCEYNASKSDDIPISYTTKDMHYKTKVNHASGGFIDDLPSWAMTQEDFDTNVEQFGINPLFIRNMSGSFDQFYSSLTGLTLANYFHFIVRYYNDLSDVERAMDVAPDIL